MKIYPAIDILNGKCVRLTEGEKEKSTVYYENPIEAAMLWEQKGARRLHVIDLDGAFAGSTKNIALLEKLIKAVKIPVQIGGGLRTIADIDAVFDIGASKAIVGTAAVMDDALLELCSKKYGDKIIVSVDAKNGYVAIDGWVNISDLSAYNFASKIVGKGLKNIIYTDISRDGTMRGPNLDGVEKMSNIELAKITASGGVKSVNDLKNLKAIGVDGAIIGRALYNGSLSLEDAISMEE